MARRLHKTLVDYLVIAISPALIMTLIGSLVFFLIEVLYQGQFEGRLRYVFALFVFAAVLVGRIAIEEGREHARLFAAPLAIAVFVVLQRFVEYQGAALAGASWAINAMLIVLILWCADKLTWNCTLIDESQRDSGKGLLQLVGLDKPPTARTTSDAEERPSVKPAGTTSRNPGSPGRWKRLLGRQRRPHAPGVWIVYFSLAALPLFGIGQLFIPPGDLAARQSAFCLLLVYVASGLGLLLTTSFLGLRRYLRRRRVEMPTVMANAWLAIGCALIAAVLIFAALLPRPNAEYAVSRLPFALGSPREEPSRHAAGDSGVEADHAELHSAESEQESGSSSPERNRKDGPTSGEPQGKGESKSGSREEETQSQSGQEQEPEAPPEGPGTEPRGKPEGNSQAHQSPSGRAAADEPRNPKSETRTADRPLPGPDGQPAPRPGDLLKNVGRTAATLLKWVFYVIVVLIAGYWLWRSRAEVLAALRGLLEGWRAFRRNLFGRGCEKVQEAAGSEGASKRPRPFADFADPFAPGTAGRYSTDELVRYSFDALEAWAREHGCPRQPQQTPHEFAQNVGTHAASVSRDARSLADLYCRVAYAPAHSVGREPGPIDETLPAVGSDPLKRLWQQLRSGADAATGIPGQSDDN